MRPRAMGFFPNSKELNYQTILRGLRLKVLLFQSIYFITSILKLFFGGSRLKNKSLHVILQRGMRHFEIPPFGLISQHLSHPLVIEG
jgi:hypothetical protein